jgi:hypothetical protein
MMLLGCFFWEDNILPGAPMWDHTIETARLSVSPDLHPPLLGNVRASKRLHAPATVCATLLLQECNS